LLRAHGRGQSCAEARLARLNEGPVSGKALAFWTRHLCCGRQSGDMACAKGVPRCACVSRRARRADGSARTPAQPESGKDVCMQLAARSGERARLGKRRGRGSRDSFEVHAAAPGKLRPRARCLLLAACCRSCLRRAALPLPPRGRSMPLRGHALQGCELQQAAATCKLHLSHARPTVPVARSPPRRAACRAAWRTFAAACRSSLLFRVTSGQRARGAVDVLNERPQQAPRSAKPARGGHGESRDGGRWVWRAPRSTICLGAR